MNVKKLIGTKVSLAPVTMDSAEKWAHWLNDLEVILPLGSEAYTPITVENMRKDIEEIISHNEHIFNIIDNQNDEAIGRCLLFSIDRVNRSSMLGIFIGEKAYWNKGFGKEAVSLLLDYAFNLLNLNSVMLGTFSFNENAIRCYKSVGFKEIGRRRQARIIGNRRYDGILMDILAEEFEGSIVDKYLDKTE